MRKESNVIPEREVEAILRDEVRRHGGQAYKFTSPGTKGVPDRIVCLPHGVLIFVELKRHGEKPRPDQEAQIRKLRAIGQGVMVVSGLQELRELFRMLSWPDAEERVQKRLDRGDL